MALRDVRGERSLCLQVTVVPWDHDLAPLYEQSDGVSASLQAHRGAISGLTCAAAVVAGLFISNGPGNPDMAQTTIDNLK